MERSLKIASKCGKNYYSVTYDLAIAKIALRIQSAEEKFNKLFINFGSLHIMFSYFKAIGKFIDGSGLVNILVDSEILATEYVDLILKQTINADAASTATGIINMTNSYAARKRWAVTHSFRTSIISQFMEHCGMIIHDDIAKDLKKASIIKANANLNTLLEIKEQYTNPFSSDFSMEHLYKLSSGQSVSEDIYEFLSTVETAGEKQRKKFIEECEIDPTRFDKVIREIKW